MYAKPDLRVFLKWMIAGSGSVITDVIQIRRSFCSMASDSKTTSVKRFRFSVRFLLLLVTASMISIVGVQRYIEFANSRPMGDVVNEINDQIDAKYKSSVIETRPLLTVDRVIDFLKSEHIQPMDTPESLSLIHI